MQTKTLTIPEWHELAQKGAAIPMRIPINGVSMFPLIRRNRDMVTIVPIAEKPVRGDIVMFAQPERDRYVLHRVWQLRGDQVLTWGDNCDGPDGWMPLDRIWGKAVRIERGRRVIEPKAARGLRWAAIWHRLGRVYRRGYGLAARVWHKLKRMAGKA